MINPNQNHYPVGHPYYSLCESLLNLPIMDYIDIIRNAEEVYVVDSAFFCLAMYLDLSKVKKKAFYARFGEDYSYLKCGLDQIQPA